MSLPYIMLTPASRLTTDVIIRPRHTVLGLFCGYSASSRIGGVDHFQWFGRHNLRIWREYDAGQEHWHDVRIIYEDTRPLAEKKLDDLISQ